MKIYLTQQFSTCLALMCLTNFKLVSS
uniref:Uncharacterized protein n=1 Tax=Arundo donax TaxID=35708 RepID=A0A0A8ZPB7_ARUDO